MLYFQGEPYENEEDFCKAIESTYTAIGKYNPTLYGYKFAYDIAPSFNFGADTRTGARLAVPALYNDYSEQRILEYKIYDVGKSMFVIKNIIFLVGMISVVSLTACSKADNNQLSRVGIENTEITVLEMEMDANYSNADPFENELLFCVSEDMETLDAEVSFQMDGESGIVEIKDRNADEILWSKIWDENVSDNTNHTN